MKNKIIFYVIILFFTGAYTSFSMESKSKVPHPAVAPGFWANNIIPYFTYQKEKIDFETLLNFICISKGALQAVLLFSKQNPHLFRFLLKKDVVAICHTNKNKTFSAETSKEAKHLLENIRIYKTLIVVEPNTLNKNIWEILSEKALIASLRLTKQVFSGSFQSSTIEELGLIQCDTKAEFHFFESFPNLKKLFYERPPKGNISHLFLSQKSKQKHKNLIILDLCVASGDKLTNQTNKNIFYSILKQFPNLKKLNMHYPLSSEWTLANLDEQKTTHQNLRNLTISSPNFSHNDIKILLQNFSSLQTLTLFDFVVHMEVVLDESSINTINNSLKCFHTTQYITDCKLVTILLTNFKNLNEVVFSVNDEHKKKIFKTLKDCGYSVEHFYGNEFLAKKLQ